MSRRITATRQPVRRAERNASTYVEISRADLEAWLDSLGTPWVRDPNHAGIYLLPLGPKVAVKVSSTIGSGDKGVGVGEGSMQLSLISTVSGDTVNKRAQGQKGFNRTKNWRENWREGVNAMRAEYAKMPDFYERNASVPDRVRYRIETMARIEAIPGWRGDERLARMHGRADERKVLTEGEHQHIAQMERRAGIGSPPPEPRPPSVPPPQRPTAPVAPAAPGPVRAVAPDAYDPRDGRPVALREAYAIAKQVGKPDAMAFARLLATQIADGVPTTEAQLRMVRAMLKDFGVPFYYPTDAEVEAALGPLRRRAATNGRRAARRSAVKARKAPRSRR